jgi:methionyl-tRNA formyltransferase
MKKIDIVFLGTPNICLPTLEALHKNPHVNLVQVISKISKPKGRGHKIQDPPVIEYCKNNSLNFFQTENINNEEELLKFFENTPPDLIVVFAFSQLLKPRILKIPKLGCYNIHASLLPRWRGASPIQYSLLNNDKLTGVTLQKMVSKLDAGDIVLQSETIIDAHDNYELLANKLMKLSPSLILNFLELILSLPPSTEIPSFPQNENQVTFAPTIKKEEGFIDFRKESTKIISNKISALNPWPGTYCFINSKRCKIFKIQTITPEMSQNYSIKSIPGDIQRINNEGLIVIRTIDGLVRIESLQFEGKSKMSAKNFLLGTKEDLKLD